MSISALGSSTATTALSAMRPAGHPPRGGGPEKTLEAVAGLLGTDTESLRSQLSSGKTMSDLASAAGISSDDLLATIAATLPPSGPDGVAVDTTAMATGIASGTRPGPPPKPETDLASGLEALSSALGISGTDLLQRLTDGTGIADLLQANPDVSSRLAADQNRGALVDGYC